VLEAVNRTVILSGYNLMIANLDRDESSERHILDLAFGGSVRGALILSSQLPVVANRSLADAGLAHRVSVARHERCIGAKRRDE
jgi:DNA-binding LacI/PurR family transcriptional regulator